MDPFWMLSKPYFNHLFWVNYLGLFCFRELHLPTMTLDSWGEGFSVIEKLIRLAEAGHRFQLCRRCSLSLPNLNGATSLRVEGGGELVVLLISWLLNDGFRSVPTTNKLILFHMHIHCCSSKRQLSINGDRNRRMIKWSDCSAFCYFIPFLFYFANLHPFDRQFISFPISHIFSQSDCLGFVFCLPMSGSCDWKILKRPHASLIPIQHRSTDVTFRQVFDFDSDMCC